MDKISKICLVSSIVISLGLICGITTYKIVSNHNEKVLLVESKAIIEQAKKCINEKKCQKDQNITLKKLYELNYLDKQVNEVTKEYYNEESYVKYDDGKYVFIDLK